VAERGVSLADLMQRVTGIGGFFFRAKDPVKLAKWYEENLGVDVVPADYNQTPWSQEAGPTVFARFPMTANISVMSKRCG
jgi:hypothetical protein